MKTKLSAALFIAVLIALAAFTGHVKAQQVAQDAKTAVPGSASDTAGSGLAGLVGTNWEGT